MELLMGFHGGRSSIYKAEATLSSLLDRGAVVPLKQRGRGCIGCLTPWVAGYISGPK